MSSSGRLFSDFCSDALLLGSLDCAIEVCVCAEIAGIHEIWRDMARHEGTCVRSGEITHTPKVASDLNGPTSDAGRAKKG